MDSVYFDNSATTKPSERVVQKAVEMLTACYGNPSSLHGIGISAENEITKAKDVLCGILNCALSELIFTSGGTESNNTAIFGIAQGYKRDGNHIITSKTEHPSVLEACRYLSEKGYDITFLDVDGCGYINTSQLLDTITNRTILVTLNHVNSETGALQPVELIGNLIKQRNKGTIFHVDGVQAFGKFKIKFKNIDLYSISGHKIHGLKGTGALYVKKGLKLVPVFFGGGQQGNLRPGTENTLGITTLAVAAKECYEYLDESYANIQKVKNHLTSLADNENVFINGCTKKDSPYILNMSFKGLKGEVLLRMLEGYGIYVSTGSACSERRKSKSPLQFYGYDAVRVDSAIRFSFSRFNTLEEADYCKEAIIKSISQLG